MAEKEESVEEQAVFAGAAVTPLTLPCSLVQLKFWVDQQASCQRPGSGPANVVSATASGITVA